MLNNLFPTPQIAKLFHNKHKKKTNKNICTLQNYNVPITFTKDGRVSLSKKFTELLNIQEGDVFVISEPNDMGGYLSFPLTIVSVHAELLPQMEVAFPISYLAEKTRPTRSAKNIIAKSFDNCTYTGKIDPGFGMIFGDETTSIQGTSSLFSEAVAPYIKVTENTIPQLLICPHEDLANNLPENVKLSDIFHKDGTFNCSSSISITLPTGHAIYEFFDNPKGTGTPIRVGETERLKSRIKDHVSKGFFSTDMNEKERRELLKNGSLRFLELPTSARPKEIRDDIQAYRMSRAIMKNGGQLPRFNKNGH